MRAIRVVAGLLAGLLVGTLGTLAINAVAEPAPPPMRDVSLGSLPVTVAEAPTTFLAWVPRGLPEGFARDAAQVPEFDEVAVVAEGIAWLRRSWSASGDLVDQPTRPFRIPLDTAAIDPATFGAFLPPADRQALAAVANGDAILGATSAALRGLGPGAILELKPDVRVRIAAVLPDELVGAAEVVVSRTTARRIGIVRDRYLLVHPQPGTVLGTGDVKAELRPLLPVELEVNRAIQVRAPGDTPFFRAGDAVLPPVLVKSVFGEFAARPDPDRAGWLEVDPLWEQDHITGVHLPAIGTVSCHRGLLPQLRGAMHELASRGLRGLIRTYHGCYVPRFIGLDSENLLSHHSWGIAFDVNLVGNYRGQIPNQPAELVEVLERWGFVWGGSWLVPDGNHFEYHRTPELEEVVG